MAIEAEAVHVQGFDTASGLEPGQRAGDIRGVGIPIRRGAARLALGFEVNRDLLGSEETPLLPFADSHGFHKVGLDGAERLEVIEVILEN